MEMTHAALDDLLERIPAPGDLLHLPPDVRPQAPVDLLDSRYGAPHTLVLDGFTDPTAGGPSGAPLLPVLEGRGETIRAWAWGDRWIGAGTARDGEGAVAVRTFDGVDVLFDCRTAEFVCRLLLDPHHRFSMARYCETPWFMSYQDLG